MTLLINFSIVLISLIFFSETKSRRNAPATLQVVLTSSAFRCRAAKSASPYAEARVSTSIGVPRGCHLGTPHSTDGFSAVASQRTRVGPPPVVRKSAFVGGRQIRAKRRDGYPQRRHGHGRGGTCTPRSRFPGRSRLRTHRGTMSGRSFQTRALRTARATHPDRCSARFSEGAFCFANEQT